MRLYEKGEKGYRVSTSCEVCGKIRRDFIETDKELNGLEIDSEVFERTNKDGWRWFGGFHKCGKCTGLKPNV